VDARLFVTYVLANRAGSHYRCG